MTRRTRLIRLLTREITKRVSKNTTSQFQQILHNSTSTQHQHDLFYYNKIIRQPNPNLVVIIA